jgi:hypothetical protein
MKYLAVFVSAFLLLAGCASDPGKKITKYDIKTVGVDPRVDSAPIRFGEVFPDENGNNKLTGFILDAIKSKPMKRLAAVMQENNINVPEMVRTNFAEAVHNLGYNYAEDRPDATFVVKLDQHGFDDRSDARVPFAALTGKLVASDGKVIWNGTSQTYTRDMMFGRLGRAFQHAPTGVGVANWKDYESDPEKLRKDWEIVIRAAVEQLLRGAKKS